MPAALVPWSAVALYTGAAADHHPAQALVHFPRSPHRPVCRLRV